MERGHGVSVSFEESFPSLLFRVCSWSTEETPHSLFGIPSKASRPQFIAPSALHGMFQVLECPFGVTAVRSLKVHATNVLASVLSI